MCDLIVALPDSTRSSRVIFGKNSDRPDGEAQVLSYSYGKYRDQDSSIHCSYLEVPEVEDPLDTLGCRPYWSWGYETGMNEARVIGGNAAIYTRPFRLGSNRQKLGLTGMELLRLGLERGETAEEAVEVISGLLERFGQWGSAVQGQDHEEGSYDNSFLLADPKEAWVLETAGRRWVAQRIEEGIRSISNEPTIRKDWDKSSGDLGLYAREQGWWDPKRGDLDFAYVYGDHEGYSRQVSHLRWRRTCQLLENDRGDLTVEHFMTILRDHYDDTFLRGPQFHPYLPDFHSVCMHDSPARFTWGNTATSVVVELHDLDPEQTPVWTDYLPPCTGIYLAFPFSADLPETITSAGTKGVSVMPPQDAPEDEFDVHSLWWRMYRILDAVQQDPVKRHEEIREVLDPIERRYLLAVEAMVSGQEVSPEGWGQLVEKEMEDVMTALEMLEKRWKVGNNYESVEEV